MNKNTKNRILIIPFFIVINIKLLIHLDKAFPCSAKKRGDIYYKEYKYPHCKGRIFIVNANKSNKYKS